MTVMLKIFIDPIGKLLAFIYFGHAEMNVGIPLECVYLTIYKHWYNTVSKKY